MKCASLGIRIDSRSSFQLSCETVILINHCSLTQQRNQLELIEKQ